MAPRARPIFKLELVKQTHTKTVHNNAVNPPAIDIGRSVDDARNEMAGIGAGIKVEGLVVADGVGNDGGQFKKVTFEVNAI